MHKNKITGKVYIGATCLKPQHRWGKRGNQYKRQKHFYIDIEKYGWDNFEHIILEYNLNYIQSKEREKYYIELYKENIYNKTKGGEQSKIKYLTEKEYNQKYIDMKNKTIEYGKHHHEEMALKSRNYYNKNEAYHQYKIEYQREYRRKHKKSNKPYRGIFDEPLEIRTIN